MKSSRPKAIVLFKSERRWCHHVVEKLEMTQELTVVHALPIIKQKGFGGLIRYLNQMVESSSFDRLFLFLDFFYGLDRSFIDSIDSSVQKILVTLDDITLHEFNLQTALACDLVLTADPISVLKYQEAGIKAGLLMLESSGRRYRPQKDVEKTTDVLFFGNEQLADRSQFLDFLEKNGIAVRKVGGSTHYINSDDLVREICQAKLVINFSKTDVLDGQNHVREGLPFLLQLKGRILEAGLCEVACISEDAPALRLLFSENELPVFRSQEGCLTLVRNYLDDDDRRSRTAQALHNKCVEKYEDAALMRNMELLIDLDYPRTTATSVSSNPKFPLGYLTRVVRARIQVVWCKPREVFRELRNTLKKTGGHSRKRRIAFLVATIAWLAYYSISQLVRRVCTKKSALGD